MSSQSDKMSGRILTVILRNDGPLIHCNDSPSYRSVQIELTDEQWEKISPKRLGTLDGKPFYECLSKCFIEPE